MELYYYKKIDYEVLDTEIDNYCKQNQILQKILFSSEAMLKDKPVFISLINWSIEELEEFLYSENFNEEISVFVIDFFQSTLLKKLKEAKISNVFIVNLDLETAIKKIDFIFKTNKNIFSDEIKSESKFIEENNYENIIIKLSKNPNINILITGETGTGKGYLAKIIHDLTNPNKPFIDIVCSAIPANLMESELFGYEKGAFTDATFQKKGLFEIAEDGTLFLDEIGELDISIQAKLLRVLDKKKFRRLGGYNDIEIKARIITATNKDLEYQIKEKRFRLDLYHRLNVVNIHLSPLKERKHEIPYFVNKFIREYQSLFPNEKIYFTEESINSLMQYDFPGNIRELKNIIEKSILFSSTESISKESLVFTNTQNVDFSESVPIELNPDRILLEVNYKNTNLKSLEKMFAQKVLSKMQNNKSKTANLLGISRPKLDNLISEV